ncbi:MULTISPECIES: hypothetical protein [unclassified Oceanispirochaeta]|uniref:hypothetical protein n=1 Tax=unclassified Oceanispirochaeta TaxID=2635722 RepID=UPI000E0998AE|nr:MULTISPECIES: hypothetical protein [unclassified Oceanispirochaeta]MBF9017213.1 hypothetical protein [Oceanispirochaeta sp. M2]NPD73662.1 hypothetical protein [Oceanispirochaeta sp. M1]RDG30592.1 hypothetical protein DV872_16340 [Oceanispirochaeta sp. M1]
METGQIRKITGISLTTAVLYNLGILSPFFAVPLQFSARDSNRSRFLSSSLFSVILILAFRAMILRPLGALGFLYVDGFILFLVVSGLYICNFELKGITLPVRIAFVTAGTAVLSMLLLPFAGGLKDQIILSLNQILSISNELNLTASGLEGDSLMNGETLFLIFQDMVGSFGLVWYFFFIAFSLWLGQSLMKRRNGTDSDTETEGWELPEVWVWFLFVPLTLYLVDRLMEVRGIDLLGRVPSYGVSNIVLITAGCYAVRGLGIIKRLMNKKGLSVQMQRILLMTTGFLIVMPGVNLALLILIAGLGVSELWVNYRIFDKE